MFKALIEASVRFRWFVVLAVALVAALGLFELTKLPIDAVPDITNRQVQITTVAPALAPEQIERQVTYPLETAMAGIPGLQSTRSLSRNGFSQITVVFTDQTDIYFARQQVAERMRQASEKLPEGVEPNLSAITTGLGEVLMWTVEFKPGVRVRPGAPGPQADGSYITPEGERRAQLFGERAQFALRAGLRDDAVERAEQPVGRDGLLHEIARACAHRGNRDFDAVAHGDDDKRQRRAPAAQFGHKFG